MGGPAAPCSHSTMLCCAVLCSVLLRSALLSSAQLCSALRCSAQLSSAQLRSAPLRSAPLRSALLCSALLCSTLHAPRSAQRRAALLLLLCHIMDTAIRIDMSSLSTKISLEQIVLELKDWHTKNASHSKASRLIHSPLL